MKNGNIKMKKRILTIGFSFVAILATGCASTPVVSHENTLQTLSNTADQAASTNSTTVSHRTWDNGHYEGSTWVRGYFKD